MGKKIKKSARWLGLLYRWEKGRLHQKDEKKIEVKKEWESWEGWEG